MNIVQLQDIKLTHRNPLYSYTLTKRKQKEKLRPLSFLLCTMEGKNMGDYTHFFPCNLTFCHQLNLLQSPDVFYLLISIKLELHCSWSFISVFYALNKFTFFIYFNITSRLLLLTLLHCIFSFLENNFLTFNGQDLGNEHRLLTQLPVILNLLIFILLCNPSS